MNDRDDDVLTDDQRVDEAGAESFPASDPPSWTTGLDRSASPTAAEEVLAGRAEPVTTRTAARH